MPCYHPLTMYRSRDGRSPVSGKWPLVSSPVGGYHDLPVTVPCGQCIGCRLERSRVWAIRCIHEAQMHKQNCFITLTFNDKHLDKELSLRKEDFQKFMKRIRFHTGIKIRYYHCGEYGSLGLRPHHHAILFGYDFPDKVLWQVRNKIPLYRSALLEYLWPFGFCTVGNVTFESAAYVARYILKKITGARAQDHYQGRVPEYNTMSRRPGIGKTWYDQYKSDVYPHGYVVIRKGLKVRPPRFYDNIYDLENHDSMLKIKAIRKMKFIKQIMREEKKTYKSVCLFGQDSCRLSVKEQAKINQLKSLRRIIE